MSAIKEREAARRQAANQDGDAPNLSALEHLEAEESKRPRAAVVHAAVRRGGEEELKRTVSSLAWSGIASGLSIMRRSRTIPTELSMVKLCRSHSIAVDRRHEPRFADKEYRCLPGLRLT